MLESHNILVYTVQIQLHTRMSTVTKSTTILHPILDCRVFIYKCRHFDDNRIAYTTTHKYD